MSKPKPYRIEVPHSEDCLAVPAARKHGRSPWAALAFQPHVWTNVWGTDRGVGRAGWHLWLRIRCNDPACPGVVRIRMTSLHSRRCADVRANRRQRIEQLRAELHDSWGKPTSYVAEREAEIKDLIETYSGPEPAPEEVA